MGNMKIPKPTKNKRKLTLDRTNLVSVNGKDYYIVDVAGDGNCLFRCFSFYLYRSEEFHFKIRQECVTYTVEHWSEEEPILRNTLEEGEDQNYPNAENYRKIMGANHTMGTDYELGVFIKIRRIPATYFRELYDSNPRSIQQVQVLDNDSSDQDSERMNILFLGNRRSGHWQILLEKTNDDEEETEDEPLPSSTQAGTLRNVRKPSPVKKSRCDWKGRLGELEALLFDKNSDFMTLSTDKSRDCMVSPVDDDADCMVSSTVNDDDNIDKEVHNDSDERHVNLPATSEIMYLDPVTGTLIEGTSNLMNTASEPNSSNFEEGNS